MRKKTLFLIALLCITIVLNAQNACMGLKNPTNFTTVGGPGQTSWTGRTGERPSNITGPGSFCNSIVNTFSATVQAANLESTIGSSGSCYGQTSTDIHGNSDYQRRFVIKGSGSDVLTNNALSYLPPDTSFHTSVRLGSSCGDHEAEELDFEMQITNENALVTIWYAMSMYNALHPTKSENPEFVILIEKQDPITQQWSLAGGDTLCYIQASPLSSGPTAPFTVVGQNVYLNWNKVIVNLYSLLYQRVKIRITTNDCCYNAHYGYCYFAGECQPMELQANGCAAGESDSVARINAPAGAQQYRWFRSKTGLLLGSNQTNMSNYELIEGATTNSLGATLSQFRHAITGDTLPQNTFCCEMTTYMNPLYPVVSRLYASTGNTKPILVVDSVMECDASITLKDLSYTRYQKVYDMDIPDTNNTVWQFYNAPNPTPQTLMNTQTGGSVHQPFNNPGNYCVKVRTRNFDSTCWNEKTVRFRTIKNPVPRVNVSRNNICKGDTIILSDMTANSRSTYHRWKFGNDTTIQHPAIGISRIFNKTTDVTLTTRGTEHYTALVNDTNGNTVNQEVYCYSDTTFTINVSAYPTPKVVGDTIVCNGNNSDIHVNDSVPNCRYDWYQVYGGTIPYLENSNALQTTITQDRTFYVKATTPEPFQCVSWDSVNLYLVKPDLTATRSRICTDDTVVLTAGRAAYFEWQSNPEDPELATQSTTSEVVVSPKVTTVYTVIGHGTNGCSATPLSQKIEVFPYPIMSVRLTPDYIDSENPSVQFSDQSEYGTTSLWDFGNGETSTFRTVVHTFTDLSEDSLQISLVTGNALGCTNDTSFWVPIGIFSVWFPNAFTPSLETNKVFQAFTANELLDYELVIFDRLGAQVFHSNNIEEGWNGTYRGFDCKEGVYVYIAKYRRKGVNRLMTQKGTVTLIR